MHAITTTSTNRPLNYSSGVNYQLLWHSDYLEIFLATDDNFLKLVWTGLPPKELIMKGAENVLSFVEKFGCTKLINDVTGVEGLFTDTVDWVITDFGPRLNASGVLNVAWIYSEDSISRFSADSVLSRSITETISIVFDNLENAERWIKAV